MATSRRAVGLAAVLAAGAGAALFPTAGSATTAPDDYCAAHLALEAAVNGEDPAAIEPAVGAALEAAPEELAGTVQAMIESAPQDGPPTPEFIAAYNEVAGWVRDNCGFGDVQVLAQDYSFGGLPEQIAGGPTVIELVNEGTELHEIVLIRRAEGFDAPLADVLAMLAEEGEGEGPPDGAEGTGPPIEGERAEPPISFAGAAFAYPGESGFGVFDLAPGNYVAVCFIPVGTTPEAFEEMMASMEGSGPPMEGSGPPMEEGAPHFTEGMAQEFTVS